MGIHKAWTMICDIELGKDENTRNSAADAKAAKRLLTEENFEKLKKRRCDMCTIINAALEFYLPTFDDTESEED